MTCVCPNPRPWVKVHKRLSAATKNQEILSRLPTPLILAGWNFSSDLDKFDRWNETVQWAQDAGCETILETLTDEDFYYSDNISSHCPDHPLEYGWNFDARERPDDQSIEDALQRLQSNWKDIATGFSEETHPVAFTGLKARRLLVSVTDGITPPWGEWARLSSDSQKRRTFTVFRRAVNQLIAPLEVDHIDFQIETSVEPL